METLRERGGKKKGEFFILVKMLLKVGDHLSKHATLQFTRRNCGKVFLEFL